MNQDNISHVLDALRIVRKEQQELIAILGQEQKQLEEELRECKKNTKFPFGIVIHRIKSV